MSRLEAPYIIIVSCREPSGIDETFCSRWDIDAEWEASKTTGTKQEISTGNHSKAEDDITGLLENSVKAENETILEKWLVYVYMVEGQDRKIAYSS